MGSGSAGAPRRALRGDTIQLHFSGLPNPRCRKSIHLPTQSRAELQMKEAAMGQDVSSPRGPRCIALVGPFQSGKTTLLEAILARTGAIPRAGRSEEHTSE